MLAVSFTALKPQISLVGKQNSSVLRSLYLGRQATLLVTKSFSPLEALRDDPLAKQVPLLNCRILSIRSRPPLDPKEAIQNSYGKECLRQRYLSLCNYLGSFFFAHHVFSVKLPPNNSFDLLLDSVGILELPAAILNTFFSKTWSLVRIVRA